MGVREPVAVGGVTNIGLSGTTSVEDEIQIPRYDLERFFSK